MLRPSLPFSSREKNNRENHTELESNRIRCHHLNDCFGPLFHCATESRLPAKWALIVSVITGISPLIGTEVYCYKRHSHVFSHLFLMATLKRNNCLHSADEETAPHMLADVVLGILTPSLGLLPLYDVSLLFLLNIHSNAATLPLAGNKQCT